MNQVQIIADSKSPQGNRLITAILTFPRYLLAEFNTHRAISRNSASSRAIRFEKMVESVQKNPFIPMKWMKDHPGMQGTEYFTEDDRITDGATLGVKAIPYLTDRWLKCRDNAVIGARSLHDLGVTKQLCNRLLEPFMYHTALVSGTELENFFALRAQDAAEIHFQDLAYKFLDAVNESEPKQLKAGEWHLPFGDEIDEDELNTELNKIGWVPLNIISGVDFLMHARIAIASIRGARISYVTPGQIGKFDYVADVKLHDRLSSQAHWSPFEHCAVAMSDDEYYSHIQGKDFRTTADEMHDYKALREKYGNKGMFNEEQFNSLPMIKGRLLHEHFITNPEEDSRFGWSGNFRGFIQYRKMFENENRSDSRLIKK